MFRRKHSYDSHEGVNVISSPLPNVVVLVGVVPLEDDLDAVGPGCLGRHVDSALVTHSRLRLRTREMQRTNMSEKLHRHTNKHTHTHTHTDNKMTLTH